ncbi:MAG TPA: inorganic phosphate transporter [Candidatus Limnocylindrales bacterium]
MSEATVLGLIAIFALSVTFDYINGFHDTANAIATSVSTRALKPEHAIVLSATANFVGALIFGTAVAGTIGSGIVQDSHILANGSMVLGAALIGAIAWNLITWALAIPSSSSHALVGGLIGAAWASAGVDAVQWGNFAVKVLVPLISSPVLGFAIGLTLMVVLLNAIGWMNPRHAVAAFRRRRSSATGIGSTSTPDDEKPAEPAVPAEPEPVIGTSPKRINDRFRRLQVLSATYMALSHGSNDAQKTMGIMTLALFSSGAIHDKTVPVWVILLAATAMSLGTAAGGWRIMKTMGQRVVKLDPVHGFAAETTAASIILGASHFGMPVSTTHVISSAIMGVGASDRVHAVHWAVARSIVTAWILTIPCAAAIAAVSYLALHLSSGAVASVLHVFGV